MDKILGVKIDNLSREEILSKVEDFLLDEKFNQIATVNPEFILQAQKDNEFKEILNNCDLNVADGVGVWFSFLRFGRILKHRMTGVDLMDEILKIANRKNLRIFLSTNDNGLASFQEIKNVIIEKYPNLEVEGNNVSACDIVFCAFGSPAQEKFLNGLKNYLPHHLSQKNIDNDIIERDNLDENSDLQHERCRGKIKLAMGIGGSFDYLVGKIKRAPKLMRMIGLEWLFRLILEPRYRFKRAWNAVIVFPIKIVLNK